MATRTQHVFVRISPRRPSALLNSYVIVHTDNLRFSHTTGILQKKMMWFIGVEVEQETSAPPPKKNPGSVPGGP